jgi:hypothetical protein
MAKKGFKVVCDPFTISARSKGRKIEDHLARQADWGWEFVAHESVTPLGIAGDTSNEMAFGGTPYLGLGQWMRALVQYLPRRCKEAMTSGSGLCC